MDGIPGASSDDRHFVGRKEELAFLEELYSRETFVTCALTGRRRIGKTALLEEFCRDKRSLFFRFRRTSLSANLSHISRVVAASADLPEEQYGDVEGALDSVRRMCADGRTVVVFDEYPFLSEISPSISSDFQHFVDMLRGTLAMVVFCGSSVSAMRSEFMEMSSPLYGRMLARYTLGPLSYRECREFHPRMDEMDALRTYLTVGGVPQYHRILAEPTYRECVAMHFLRLGSELCEESETVISCELSPVGKHVAIVDALAEGRRDLKRISEWTGYPKSTCSRMLDDLETIGVVDRIRPMAMGKRDRPYDIADSLVAFSYAVIRRHPDLGMHSDTLGAYDAIRGEVSSFLGHRFERFCADYIRENYITLDIGKWWGRIDGEDTDVDVVAKVTEDDIRYDLYCECKFRGRPATFAAYEELRGKVSFINRDRGPPNCRYVIFSASGFSESLLEAGDTDPELILVDLETVTGGRPAPRLRKGPSRRARGPGAIGTGTCPSRRCVSVTGPRSP